MKTPKVTVDELLAEINNGTHYVGSPDSRERLNNIILQMQSIIVARKLATPPTPKKTRPAALQMTIAAWEEQHGKLTIAGLSKWILQNQFCPLTIAALVEEFRTSMIAKGLRYADFRAAFQTYLNSGYLSQTKEDCLKKNSKFTQNDTSRTYTGASV